MLENTRRRLWTLVLWAFLFTILATTVPIFAEHTYPESLTDTGSFTSPAR